MHALQEAARIPSFEPPADVPARDIPAAQDLETDVDTAAHDEQLGGHVGAAAMAADLPALSGAHHAEPLTACSCQDL